jgi:hypothetical protein
MLHCGVSVVLPDDKLVQIFFNQASPPGVKFSDSYCSYSNRRDMQKPLS